jgi:hypothetical protein
MIPKFVEALPVFGSSLGIEPGQVNAPRITGPAITVAIGEVQQRVLPVDVYTGLLPPYDSGTYVWAYNVGNTIPLYPGITIEAQRNTPTDVTYVNGLPVSGAQVQLYITVDQTIQ